MEDYRIINLNNGDYIQIKYDVDGIVYDRSDKEIRNIVENKY